MERTMPYLMKRIIAALGCGLGLLFVSAAGWGEIRWAATGIPIMTGILAAVLLDAWKARRPKS
jgi:hypothetical protein